MGQKRKSSNRANVFRSCSNNGHPFAISAGPLGAIFGLIHRSKKHSYSITSSAQGTRQAEHINRPVYATRAAMYCVRCSARRARICSRIFVPEIFIVERSSSSSMSGIAFL